MSIDTILGFDFGIKRIGVAMGNSLIRQAAPLAVISSVGNDARFAEIGALIEKWAPTRFVVGLPMHPDGTPHEMNMQATGRWLASDCGSIKPITLPKQ